MLLPLNYLKKKIIYLSVLCNRNQKEKRDRVIKYKWLSFMCQVIQWNPAEKKHMRHWTIDLRQIWFNLNWENFYHSMFNSLSMNILITYAIRIRSDTQLKFHTSKFQQSVLWLNFSFFILFAYFVLMMEYHSFSIS